MRRAFLAALSLFVAVGLLGLLGPHHRDVVATGQGYELTVRYADRSRPGLGTRWTAQIRAAGGFDGPVTLATTAVYFDLFDEHGLDPEPASATTSGDFLVWEFEPPVGDVLTVSFDGRIEPGTQSPWPAPAHTRLIVDGALVAEVSYRTRVFP